MKEKAYEILDIAQKIYSINESTNPNAIFGNKIFVIGTEEDPNAISVERDYEKTDSTYYFETSEIKGAIIKRANGNFCVKAMVKYTNEDNCELWFAKIRIEPFYDGDIRIMGFCCGSLDAEDFYDEDLIKNPNSDFPVALDSMRNHLVNIYNQLCNSELNSDAFDSEWVRKLKKYND